VEFTGNEAQEDVRGVVSDVLDKGDASWQAMREAGLIGLALPESFDGEGLGLSEVAVLLHELGRRALDLPVLETLVQVALPLARVGTADQQARFLPAIGDGSLIATAALAEPGDALPSLPRTTLRRSGEGWTLSGHKIGVRSGTVAGLLLVSARLADSDQACVVLVDPAASGVSRTATASSRHAEEATIDFDGVSVSDSDILGGRAAAVAAHDVVLEHTVAGLVALCDGLLAGATTLTAGYIKERQQFGRVLAEFQAVAMQIADVFIASRTLELASMAATWKVAGGLPAGDDLAVAGYWAAAKALPAVHTCHHLHGGMGIDETYPLHHFYSGVKDVVRALGGVTGTLARVPVSETLGKDAELTQEQRAFKAEVRAYFATLVSDAERQEMLVDRHGPAYHRTIKKMGADGWMGVGWPTEYGGRGMGEIEQQIFVNEAARADVHLPSVTLQTVGPTLQKYGTQKQKDMFLADILTGDVHFAIGYSEPEAGTDLASLRTSARRDGDHYVVNGQKIFTTGGHAADYVWLATRTDPDAPKHKGITVMIVDTKDPGYSWTPIVTCEGSHHTNQTYYQDVRVPVDMVVGGENEGWKLITTQLNHERVMLAPAGRLEGMRDMVRDWAESHTAPDGRPVVEQTSVREALARATATFRVNELMNWQVVTGAGTNMVADASASKVFASDAAQELGRALEEVVVTYGDPADAETRELLAFLDSQSKRYLVLTFGGGVNEVQRELVAMFGLGLPRVPR
jgi:hypothetical protein